MSSEIIAKGKTVFFTYRITLSFNDVTVDESDIPIGYVHGYNDPADKVELSLEGHSVGHVVSVPFDKSESMYPYNPDLVFSDSLVNVPTKFHHIGAQFELANDKGERKLFHVVDIKDGKLIMDGNHPLAGKDIIFHATVKTIRDATDEELETGLVDNNLAPGKIH